MVCERPPSLASLASPPHEGEINLYSPLRGGRAAEGGRGPLTHNLGLAACKESPLAGPAEFFLKQSNFFFHGLLRSGRDGFDGGLCRAGWLLGFPIFASRLFRLLALSLGSRDRLWKAFRRSS